MLQIWLMVCYDDKTTKQFMMTKTINSTSATLLIALSFFSLTSFNLIGGYGELPDILKRRQQENNRASDITVDSVQQHVNRFLLDDKKISPRLTDSNSGVRLTLQNIDVSKSFIYFKLSVYNRSSLTYNVGSLNVELMGRKAKKVSGDLSFAFKESVKQVASNTEETLIYAMPTYGLLDKDLVNVKINEGNGRRVLSLSIQGQMILEVQRTK